MKYVMLPSVDFTMSYVRLFFSITLPDIHTSSFCKQQLLHTQHYDQSTFDVIKYKLTLLEKIDLF